MLKVRIEFSISFSFHGRPGGQWTKRSSALDFFRPAAGPKFQSGHAAVVFHTGR
jgi:hypothetical protein